jgi:hypothetical protein
METEKLKVGEDQASDKERQCRNRELGPPSWAARRGASAGGQPESEQADKKLRAENRRMHEHAESTWAPWLVQKKARMPPNPPG